MMASGLVAVLLDRTITTTKVVPPVDRRLLAAHGFLSPRRANPLLDRDDVYQREPPADSTVPGSACLLWSSVHTIGRIGQTLDMSYDERVRQNELWQSVDGQWVVRPDMAACPRLR
jgi:hypothetical protein